MFTFLQWNAKLRQLIPKVLLRLIFLTKSPRKLYHRAMGWIHKPRTVLVSFQGKNKQEILGIVCGLLSRNSKYSLAASYWMGWGASLPLRLCTTPKFLMIKIFPNGVHSQQFQIFKQMFDLSSFFEEFCLVKLVWVKGKVIRPVASVTWKMTMAGRLQIRKGHNTWDSLDHWLVLAGFLFREHSHSREEKDSNTASTTKFKLP